MDDKLPHINKLINLTEYQKGGTTNTISNMVLIINNIIIKYINDMSDVLSNNINSVYDPYIKNITIQYSTFDKKQYYITDINTIVKILDNIDDVTVQNKFTNLLLYSDNKTIVTNKFIELHKYYSKIYNDIIINKGLFEKIIDTKNKKITKLHNITQSLNIKRDNEKTCVINDKYIIKYNNSIAIQLIQQIENVKYLLENTDYSIDSIINIMYYINQNNPIRFIIKNNIFTVQKMQKIIYLYKKFIDTLKNMIFQIKNEQFHTYDIDVIWELYDFILNIKLKNLEYSTDNIENKKVLFLLDKSLNEMVPSINILLNNVLEYYASNKKIDTYIIKNIFNEYNKIISYSKELDIATPHVDIKKLQLYKSVNNPTNKNIQNVINDINEVLVTIKNIFGSTNFNENTEKNYTDLSIIRLINDIEDKQCLSLLLIKYQKSNDNILHQIIINMINIKLHNTTDYSILHTSYIKLLNSIYFKPFIGLLTYEIKIFYMYYLLQLTNKIYDSIDILKIKNKKIEKANEYLNTILNDFITNAIDDNIPKLENIINSLRLLRIDNTNKNLLNIVNDINYLIHEIHKMILEKSKLSKYYSDIQPSCIQHNYFMIENECTKDNIYNRELENITSIIKKSKTLEELRQIINEISNKFSLLQPQLLDINDLLKKSSNIKDFIKTYDNINNLTNTNELKKYINIILNHVFDIVYILNIVEEELSSEYRSILKEQKGGAPPAPAPVIYDLITVEQQQLIRYRPSNQIFNTVLKYNALLDIRPALITNDEINRLIYNFKTCIITYVTEILHNSIRKKDNDNFSNKYSEIFAKLNLSMFNKVANILDTYDTRFIDYFKFYYIDKNNTVITNALFIGRIDDTNITTYDLEEFNQVFLLIQLFKQVIQLFIIENQSDAYLYNIILSSYNYLATINLVGYLYNNIHNITNTEINENVLYIKQSLKNLLQNITEINNIVDKFNRIPSNMESIYVPYNVIYTVNTTTDPVYNNIYFTNTITFINTFMNTNVINDSLHTNNIIQIDDNSINNFSEYLIYYFCELLNYYNTLDQKNAFDYICALIIAHINVNHHPLNVIDINNIFAIETIFMHLKTICGEKTFTILQTKYYKKGSYVELLKELVFYLRFNELPNSRIIIDNSSSNSNKIKISTSLFNCINKNSDIKYSYDNTSNIYSNLKYLYSVNKYNKTDEYKDCIDSLFNINETLYVNNNDAYYISKVLGLTYSGSYEQVQNNTTNKIITVPGISNHIVCNQSYKGTIYNIIEKYIRLFEYENSNKNIERSIEYLLKLHDYNSIINSHKIVSLNDYIESYRKEVYCKKTNVFVINTKYNDFMLKYNDNFIVPIYSYITGINFDKFQLGLLNTSIVTFDKINHNFSLKNYYTAESIDHSEKVELLGRGIEDISNSVTLQQKTYTIYNKIRYEPNIPECTMTTITNTDFTKYANKDFMILYKYFKRYEDLFESSLFSYIMILLRPTDKNIVDDIIVDIRNLQDMQNRNETLNTILNILLTKYNSSTVTREDIPNKDNIYREYNNLKRRIRRNTDLNYEMIIFIKYCFILNNELRSTTTSIDKLLYINKNIVKFDISKVYTKYITDITPSYSNPEYNDIITGDDYINIIHSTLNDIFNSYTDDKNNGLRLLLEYFKNNFRKKLSHYNNSINNIKDIYKNIKLFINSLLNLSDKFKFKYAQIKNLDRLLCLGKFIELEEFKHYHYYLISTYSAILMLNKLSDFNSADLNVHKSITNNALLLIRSGNITSVDYAYLLAKNLATDINNNKHKNVICTMALVISTVNNLDVDNISDRRIDEYVVDSTIESNNVDRKISNMYNIYITHISDTKRQQLTSMIFNSSQSMIKVMYSLTLIPLYNSILIDKQHTMKKIKTVKELLKRCMIAMYVGVVNSDKELTGGSRSIIGNPPLVDSTMSDINILDKILNNKQSKKDIIPIYKLTERRKKYELLPYVQLYTYEHNLNNKIRKHTRKMLSLGTDVLDMLHSKGLKLNYTSHNNICIINTLIDFGLLDSLDRIFNLFDLYKNQIKQYCVEKLLNNNKYYFEDINKITDRLISSPMDVLSKYKIPNLYNILSSLTIQTFNLFEKELMKIENYTDINEYYTVNNFLNKLNSNKISKNYHYNNIFIKELDNIDINISKYSNELNQLKKIRRKVDTRVEDIRHLDIKIDKYSKILNKYINDKRSIKNLNVDLAGKYYNYYHLLQINETIDSINNSSTIIYSLFNKLITSLKNNSFDDINEIKSCLNVMKNIAYTYFDKNIGQEYTEIEGIHSIIVSAVQQLVAEFVEHTIFTTLYKHLPDKDDKNNMFIDILTQFNNIFLTNTLYYFRSYLSDYIGTNIADKYFYAFNIYIKIDIEKNISILRNRLNDIPLLKDNDTINNFLDVSFKQLLNDVEIVITHIENIYENIINMTYYTHVFN